MPPIQKKVCLLGDFAVGKTSLIRWFVEGDFSDQYLSTIGTKISRKQVTIPVEAGSIELKMLIWDLAGGEKFGPLMENYYRGAAGAILVCDVTRAETLNNLLNCAREFWGVNPHVPLVVVGNKVDLINQRVISDDALSDAATRLQAPWFVSSAKSGEHVEEIFFTLGQQIVQASKAAHS